MLLIAGAVFVVLIAFSAGYGYHRDELYFLAAGRQPAWAYPDQGPVTPLIAALMNWVDPGSLVVLRLPSAVAAAGTVLLTGFLCCEVGGGRGAQLLAATCSAVAVIVLFTGHTLSTSTFDLLVWTAVTYLAVRAVRTERPWLWPAAGVVLGVGLENKPLPAFLAAALLAGLALSGPRRVLREPWFWLGAAIAALMWSPWLVWQAANGW
ncbi:MAG: glycosyltransferase family 39 protein, partial [Terracoccus sp.]